MNDAAWMARALQLARRGLYTTHPNPRVGCVLVSNGEMVGEGWHERAGEAHAEVMALAAAGKRAQGATAYVTLEPCCHQGRTAPCTQALIKAGVRHVVAAMSDPNPQVAGAGLAELQRAGVNVNSGLLQAEAQALNRGFIKRMQDGRPWVTIKLAMSLDGRTAAANGSSQWITGHQARSDGHRLRATAGAVLTGIGTVLADNPQLNCRLEDAADWPVPQRFVLDSQLRMPLTARMLSLPGRTVVLTGSQDAGKAAALQAAGAEVVVLPVQTGRVDLQAVLAWLASEQINEILIEAGPTLAGAFVAQGLSDELVIYMAPTLLGDDGRGLLTLPGVETIDAQQGLQIQEIRAIGADWRIKAALRR